MSSADTNDVIDEVEAEVAPKLAAHNDQILLNAELATLRISFSQNVLNEVNAASVIVDTREELNPKSTSCSTGSRNSKSACLFPSHARRLRQGNV